MEASIQTQKRKKNNQNSFSMPDEGSITSQKDKKQKIKKLAQINKQLIETLKKQNQQLTKKINKQKSKPPGHRSVSVSGTQSPKNMQSTKKQLANAYKQIQMYKSILQNLKAKQISTDSLDKINQLQNRIKIQDSSIDTLQKELKFLKNIKDQQEKEVQVFQNDDVKKNVAQLQEQVKTLKEKIKVAKKQAQKRQQLQKKQHQYFMELQKQLRKQNQEYYPGKTQTKTFAPKQQKDNNIMNQITQKQWTDTKAQLIELKKNHDQTNKKIQLLSRQRNKEIKSFQQNQIKLKEKMKKLQQVRNKLAELTKLVTIKETPNDQGQNQEEEEDEDAANYQSVTKNGKKSYKARNPNKQRQVKRWAIPQGYALQKGKILPDSIFFSDKTILKNVKKSKIIEIHVWTDSQNCPCLFQFYYSCEKGKKYQGIQPYSGSISHLQENIISFKQGDFLSKLVGKMQGGYLVSIQLTSKFGQKSLFNKESSSQAQQFKFQARPNELPSCMFGAIVKNDEDQIRICHLGCEFISDW